MKSSNRSTTYWTWVSQGKMKPSKTITMARRQSTESFPLAQFSIMTPSMALATYMEQSPHRPILGRVITTCPSQVMALSAALMRPPAIQSTPTATQPPLGRSQPSSPTPFCKKILRMLTRRTSSKSSLEISVVWRLALREAGTRIQRRSKLRLKMMALLPLPWGNSFLEDSSSSRISNRPSICNCQRGRTRTKTRNTTHERPYIPPL